MKCFITGGTGFVGRYLAKRFTEEGHTVSVLTRKAGKRVPLPGITPVEGDPTRTGPWQESVPGHDVVVNLAGASIFTYWTERAKREILESRVLTTRNLVDAMAPAGGNIRLLSASAVGYYGSKTGDLVLDEFSPPGDDFLARLAVQWEQEALRAKESGAEVSLCRFGIILGKNGGALAKMLPAFSLGFGAPLGNGRQWFPWIHMEDLFRIFLHLAEGPSMSGPVNCTAPNPERNVDVGRILAGALRRPYFMPSPPRFLVKLALGEFADVLLEGQRVLPQRLTEAGFVFRFPTLAGAVEDLLA